MRNDEARAAAGRLFHFPNGRGKMKDVNRRWFSMKGDDASAEISIFSEIGEWGVTVSDFKKEFDALKSAKAITLYINSPGGSVFDGMAIYNILAGVKDKITTKVLGLAASVSSIIALAGKRLIMAEGTYFMIHDPWALAMGTGSEMRKTADLLDSIGNGMADIYAARSAYSRDEIVSLMAAETWLSADEAVEAGFADDVVESEAIAALGDLSKFKYQHAPAAVLARSDKKDNPPATPRDLERLLRDAGYSRSTAAGIVADGFSAVSGAGCPDEKDSGTEPITPAADETKVIHIASERLRAMRARLRLLAMAS
jgi:ATP-dependent Clp endopeptidase proteolytic subunit ClpP